MTAHLRLITPNNENRSVPVRPPNSELRTREYLTPKEVEKLIKAAKDVRWGHRDATLVLVAVRHGLRASEICDLEWSQVEFGRSPSLHVRRAKNGKPSVHPLRGDEVRALRRLHAETKGNFVFETERSGPFTPDAVNRQIKRLGERAGLDFPVHAHMLRHGCGYALANAGHDTRAIQDTARYSTRCVTLSWRRRGLRTSGGSSGVAVYQTRAPQPHQRPPLSHSGVFSHRSYAAFSNLRNRDAEAGRDDARYTTAHPTKARAPAKKNIVVSRPRWRYEAAN